MDELPPAAPPASPAQDVARARAGDREAFGRIYLAWAPLVHGVLLARVAPGDADDLVQDVFLAAWRGLAGLRDEAALPGWLATIARRAANRARARGASRPQPLPADLPDTRPSPSADRSEAILSELRALPEAYRETLALRLVEGLPGRAIADATGLSPDSVRVNLSRGTRLLRERLLRRGLT
ncbi:MAG: sigma-70 family RNA polymerase sigma factor [Planctomycetes bacterium]|nr:sigma-70 family RNA polymerase sigma factor [Planctomycetota bacterium]